MTEITNYNSKTIKELMTRIEEFKYSPVGIQKTIFNLLDEVANGELDIVDPTNPFVFLLESSSVNTAVAINENLINLRKQYPSLAKDISDLYYHMSDIDYIGRFASPSSANITLTLQVNDIENEFKVDNSLPGKKATIPRNTEITIDNITFSLQYPIEIIKFDNGVVQVRYITDKKSPLQTLTSNIIDYKVKTDINNIQWIYFDVPVDQFKVDSVHYPVQNSFLFQEEIVFSDQYYYCRVWTKNNVGEWIEITTTHSDQVYDESVPTALLTVKETSLIVTIPSMYVTNGLVSSSIRIDIYTTKGNLSLDLSNYDITAFNINLKALDTDNDLDIFTSAMSSVNLFAYSSSFINSGTNSLGFDELKNRVINNSLGSKSLPITNLQLDSYVTDKGFKLVKNIDVVTNRIFLATKSLPKPLNNQLITPASIGITTFVADTNIINSISKVKDNGNRLTLISNSMFLLENGVLKLLNDSELNDLNTLSKNNLIVELNSKKYLYNPYYYVFDSSYQEFDLRAYDLDSPSVRDLSFISQNETLQLPVNTGSYYIEKIDVGYKLTIVSKSGNFYKQLNDSEVDIQLAFKPNNVNKFTYINGSIDGLDANGERIFSFIIETNYDIDSNDRITITNSKLFDNNAIDVEIDLALDMHIFYTTTSLTPNYLSDEADSLIGKFILPAGSTAITHESLHVELGKSLKNLWSRTRVIPTGLTYERYTTDVPLLYTEPVYEVDPVTNSIFTIDNTGNLIYNVLHQIGDPVLDSNGDPVYKHRAGDVVLDNNGDPVISQSLSNIKEMDILLVDGKYLYSDDANIINYREELKSILTSWITNDLTNIQNILLEQTKIFFYNKKNLGLIQVKPENDLDVLIDAEQSFSLNLYVTDDVFNNIELRQNIVRDTTVTIHNYITNNRLIKMIDLYNLLIDLYNDSVVSFDIEGLGGSSNYNLVELINEQDTLALKKRLTIQQDNTIIVDEDINIDFHNLGL